MWCRVALLSFGGSAGQIAVIHRMLVEEKRWISESRFLHALNYCMVLPGPEVQQLTIYLGWLLHRAKGGLVAGSLFVLPGFAALLALSVTYGLYGASPLVQGLFFGLKPAVLAVVAHALVGIAGRALPNAVTKVIAAAAFLGVFALGVPFPAVVGLAAAGGFLVGRLRPDLFGRRPDLPPEAGALGDDEPALDAALARGTVEPVRPSGPRAALVLAIWLPLWALPVAVAWALLGGDHILVQIGLFFGKAAVVTFGGAYAVLAYVAQEAVGSLGWLAPGEMLDGLGMAETTPGPLIMVVEFVGFLGAYRHPGGLDPLTAGILGAVITTWVTFVPCFLWIFLGAPHVERLRGHRDVNAALSGITAAVVGVVFNLAVWFSIHVIFTAERAMAVGPVTIHPPVWASVDPPSAVLAVTALVAMFGFRAGMVPTLAASAAIGAGWVNFGP